jgi:hypothetical protein
MIGMLRKSAAFVPRYYKFESIPLQRRVGNELFLALGVSAIVRVNTSRVRPNGFDQNTRR